MMRFAIPLFLLSCNAFATPNVVSIRDTSIIERNLSNVSGALKRLTTAIQSLDPQLRGDLFKQETDIENRSQDVINALNSGASEIRRAPMVEILESLRLIDIVNSLTATTQTTMNAWINAKPTVIQAGGRQPVLNILNRAEKALDDFTDAIVNKLPLTGIALGRLAGQKSKALVQEAIGVYRT